MIVEIITKKEVNLKFLMLKASVIYWEESKVNAVYDNTAGDNMPCKIGRNWCPHIDIDTGIILNWTQGVKANIQYSVRYMDYTIQDAQGVIIVSKEKYLGLTPKTLRPKAIDLGLPPKTLKPETQHYEHFIHMDIDENGQIADWKFYINDFNN